MNYGFIVPDGYADEHKMFVKANDLPRGVDSLAPGQRVSFLFRERPAEKPKFGQNKKATEFQAWSVWLLSDA